MRKKRNVVGELSKVRRLIALLFVFSVMPLTAYASEIKFFLNDKQIIFEQPPISDNSRTMVVLRSIFEAMGATVTWEGNCR